ncbi:MAG: hypothetical protein HETSPECPRED_007082 [Heterodermia speciosa]|uniref:Uncharacterized protein n=1 Tax=Heterodermia speciosa TaxID=116794 RepID=A0A8H3IBB6_9LECA|nr:MAG: hypothetical protein HETSPECPRED_007082 [Heterodermia speciosa]
MALAVYIERGITILPSTRKLIAVPRFELVQNANSLPQARRPTRKLRWARKPIKASGAYVAQQPECHEADGVMETGTMARPDWTQAESSVEKRELRDTDQMTRDRASQR